MKTNSANKQTYTRTQKITDRTTFLALSKPVEELIK